MEENELDKLRQAAAHIEQAAHKMRGCRQPQIEAGLLTLLARVNKAQAKLLRGGVQ